MLPRIPVDSNNWTVLFAAKRDQFIKHPADFEEKAEAVSTEIASASKNITKIRKKVKGDRQKPRNKYRWFRIPKDKDEKRLFLYLAANQIATFVVPNQTKYRLLKENDSFSIISKEIPGFQRFSDYYNKHYFDPEKTNFEMCVKILASDLPEDFGAIVFIKYLFQEQDFSLMNFGLNADNHVVGIDYEACFKPPTVGSAETLIKQVFEQNKLAELSSGSINVVEKLFGRFINELENHYGDETADIFVKNVSKVASRREFINVLGEKITDLFEKLIFSGNFNEVLDSPFFLLYDKFLLIQEAAKRASQLHDSEPSCGDQVLSYLKVFEKIKKILEDECVTILKNLLPTHNINEEKELQIGYITNQGHEEIQDSMPCVGLPSWEAHMIPRIKDDINFFNREDYDSLPLVKNATPQRWNFRAPDLRYFSIAIAEHEQFLNSKHYATLKMFLILPLCQLILDTLLPPKELISFQTYMSGAQKIAIEKNIHLDEAYLRLIENHYEKIKNEVAEQTTCNKTAYDQLVKGLVVCITSDKFQAYFGQHYLNAIKVIIYELSKDMHNNKQNRGEDEKLMMQKWQGVTRDILERTNHLIRTLQSGLAVKPLNCKEKKSLFKFAKRAGMNQYSDGMVNSIYRFYQAQGRKNCASALVQSVIFTQVPSQVASKVIADYLGDDLVLGGYNKKL